MLHSTGHRQRAQLRTLITIVIHNSFTVTLVPSSSFCMSYLALSLGGTLYSELLICLKGGKK